MHAVPQGTQTVHKPGRIPSLDGLRALSIFLVVALHTTQRFSLTHHVPAVWYGIFNGAYGVYIFFEISGFLITTLLLNEQEGRGRISLRGFYLRRAFRILPPLYLYLGVVVLLGLAGLLELNWQSVASAAFFFHNFYAPGGMWSLEHLWSISIEEQFYLVWPFILVFCLRKGLHRGRRNAAWFPIAVILVSPVFRSVLRLSHEPVLRDIGMSLFRFDFIMYGCLTALLQGTSRFERLYERATRIWWLPPAIIVACSFISSRFQNYFDLTVGFTINGAAVAIFLLWCTRNPTTIVGKLLNFGPIAFLGVISYSIYLWQTLWLHQGNQRIFSWFPPAANFPLNWLGILLCALGSFYLIEQPSLRVRNVVVRKLRGVPPSNAPSIEQRAEEATKIETA